MRRGIPVVMIAQKGPPFDEIDATRRGAHANLLHAMTGTCRQVPTAHMLP